MSCALSLAKYVGAPPACWLTTQLFLSRPLTRGEIMFEPIVSKNNFPAPLRLSLLKKTVPARLVSEEAHA